jgi:hypothetical protein
MGRKYQTIDALNAAWSTSFRSFDDVTFPPQISDENFKPHPDAFTSPGARRQWVDFITWYHQAIIDFAEQSIRTTLKYFPKEKVRTKPGGNAGGVNPIAWGTYCPGYAKMAAKYSIVLQPADWQGKYFGDKWVGTAYAFYGVPLSTEPAGGADHADFLRAMFSDAACGARQFFTYDFPKHAADIRAHVHLLTGHPAETEVALLCPTTLYRLGGDLKPTIDFATKFRDVTDFDVLDELLIADGALTPEKYKALVIYQGDFSDSPILKKLEAYLHAGGTIFVAGSDAPTDLDGHAWKPRLDPKKDGKLIYCGAKLADRFTKFAAAAKLEGFDGVADGVWTVRRGEQVILLNRTDKPVKVGSTEVPPHELWSSE